eukprot:TRINITY_DN3961_c0_g1_i4.p1 TRINITY_DN3961_c0_g1~~TRINITY_DN3961_c0_g1_i4.p1  ORF type:complete len:530 (+),score=104.57 TRINITY_DN3961_c0_g1_i4:124-1590(+)
MGLQEDAVQVLLTKDSSRISQYPAVAAFFRLMENNPKLSRSFQMNPPAKLALLRRAAYAYCRAGSAFLGLECMRELRTLAASMPKPRHFMAIQQAVYAETALLLRERAALNALAGTRIAFDPDMRSGISECQRETGMLADINFFKREWAMNIDEQITFRHVLHYSHVRQFFLRYLFLNYVLPGDLPAQIDSINKLLHLEIETLCVILSSLGRVPSFDFRMPHHLPSGFRPILLTTLKTLLDWREMIISSEISNPEKPQLKLDFVEHPLLISFIHCAMFLLALHDENFDVINDLNHSNFSTDQSQMCQIYQQLQEAGAREERRGPPPAITPLSETSSEELFAQFSEDVTIFLALHRFVDQFSARYCRHGRGVRSIPCLHRLASIWNYYLDRQSLWIWHRFQAAVDNHITDYLNGLSLRNGLAALHACRLNGLLKLFEASGAKRLCRYVDEDVTKLAQAMKTGDREYYESVELFKKSGDVPHVLCVDTTA